MHKQLAIQFEEIANLPPKGESFGGSNLGRSIASSQSRVTRLNKQALGELGEDLKEDLFPVESMSQYNSTRPNT
jgi:hypothetical protein